MKKDFGGLGIPNLQEINICLLGSWIKRFYEEDLKPWKPLVAHKYLGNKPNIFVPSSNPKTSRFWKGLKIYYACCEIWLQMEHRGWEQNQVLGRYLVWHIPPSSPILAYLLCPQ